MNTTKLLERIQYRGSLDLTLETLARLQRSFLLAVPFENLDIHLGRHIEMTPDAVYTKVVDRKRGGFCYELNSLFHHLLQSLGFSAGFLAAQMIRDGVPGTVMGHMVLIVDVDGHRYLVDVGNGKSFREPLNLDGTGEHGSEDIRYRVGRIGLGPAVLQTGPGGEWLPRFVFDERRRRPEEFLDVCEWTQSSADSRFTQNRICTLARPNGRVTLLNEKLTLEEDGNSEERDIAEEERETCLLEYFGIPPAELK